MEKQIARIYLDENVNLIGTLQKNLSKEEFNNVSILPNRVTMCSENKGEVSAFCLIGITLGLKVEYLIANSFFSPISVSYKDMNKVEIKENTAHISGSSFSFDFDIVKLS